MEDRRKSKRTQMQSTLLMKRLDNNGNDEVDIEIVDVSKSGIGFTTKTLLEIGQVYEAFLTIWTKEVIHALIQIVRIELKDEYYVYGAIFIGMPPADANRIEVYQIFNDEDE